MRTTGPAPDISLAELLEHRVTLQADEAVAIARALADRFAAIVPYQERARDRRNRSADTEGVADLRGVRVRPAG